MYVRYTQPKGLKAQFEIIHYGEGQIHMKCPICGQELRPGKKDPNYLLCYNCKKKFKIPQSAHKVQKRAEKPEPEEQKYSNIPPKEVREKREQEMRDAYDELLAVGDGRKKKKPTPKPQRREELEDDFYDDIDGRKKKKPTPKPQRREELEDDFYDDIEEEEEKMSKAPIIILAIAIIVVAGLIAFMLLR